MLLSLLTETEAETQKREVICKQHRKNKGLLDFWATFLLSFLTVCLRQVGVGICAGGGQQGRKQVLICRFSCNSRGHLLFYRNRSCLVFIPPVSFIHTKKKIFKNNISNNMYPECINNSLKWAKIWIETSPVKIHTCPKNMWKDAQHQ